MDYQKRFYVVWVGRHPGVYDNLQDAMEQVEDYPGAVFKSFASSEEASEAFRKSERSNDKRELAGLLLDAASRNVPADGKPDYFSFPEIDLKGWAVDASCQGNPGIMEYRGVDLMSVRAIHQQHRGVSRHRACAGSDAADRRDPHNIFRFRDRHGMGTRPEGEDTAQAHAT